MMPYAVRKAKKGDKARTTTARIPTMITAITHMGNFLPFEEPVPLLLLPADTEGGAGDGVAPPDALGEGVAVAVADGAGG